MDAASSNQLDAELKYPSVGDDSVDVLLGKKEGQRQVQKRLDTVQLV